MIKGLAKALVYGYVGGHVVSGLKNSMDEGRRGKAEAIRQLKNFAFVIYDGKAPYTAAQNLAKYLEEEGYQSAAIDREQYRRLEGTPAEEYSRMVIIGHHDFTKEQMASVPLHSDHYGLKMGIKGRRYVLRACRSDLPRGKKGRQEFAAYYGQVMSDYKELAERYGVPTTFGHRSGTRESQYDLLWLECVRMLQQSIEMERLAARVGPMPPPAY